MTFVFDATPLIYLGKADRLDVLENLRRETLVPNPVYEEVVHRGLRKGYVDAKRVNQFVRDGALQQRSVEKPTRFERLTKETKLSAADTAVLSLADEVDGTAIMDESYGREIADTEGVKTRGTAYFLLLLAKRGDIDAGEARGIIDVMVDSGWHCSTDLYADILRKLEEIAPE